MIDDSSTGFLIELTRQLLEWGDLSPVCFANVAALFSPNAESSHNAPHSKIKIETEPAPG